MKNLGLPLLIFIILAASCSSSDAGDAPAQVASTESSTTSGPADTSAVSEPTPRGTLISAADGGEISFGDDVTLTIAPGALSSDTEITISALPPSEWPEGLLGLTDVSVVGEFLRLSPDGLTFSEPAVLRRRAPELVDAADGEVSITPSISLSRSSGVWEALQQTIVVDGSDATVEIPIEHFSDNVILATGVKGGHIKARLTPGRVQRLVGRHFIADLSIEIALAPTEPEPEDPIHEGWWVRFGFSQVSSDDPEQSAAILRLGVPSVYQVESDQTSTGVDTVTAPSRTPMPTQFPAAYNCIRVGKAAIAANFRFKFQTPTHYFPFVGDNYRGPRPDTFIHGIVQGEAECVASSDDLTPGIVDVTSSLESDLAGHSCCVTPPTLRARMTRGSLWFSDAKLGSSTDWQGLFFDPQPGSTDDVMQPVNDDSAVARNALEIVTADDFSDSGHFTVTGRGTVAGFPDIAVELDAIAADRGDWSGTLAKGVDGGLPTGQPIIYNISGSLIAPQPVQFVTDLAKALRENDSQYLLDHLDPAVLGIYAGDCVDFVNSISSPDLTIDVHSFADVADWTTTLDGHELLIRNTISLDVTRTESGESTRTIMHVAPRPSDGPPTEMTWFADCGDPLISSEPLG